MSDTKNSYDKEDARVSICIPVYNAERYVYAAIYSALTQTHKNTEVIVLDDASADDTALICKSFGDRIRYLKNEANMGIGYGRMRLANEAGGEYVVFCSADDILSGTFVEEMLKRAEPGKILYCGSLIINESGKVLKEYMPLEFSDDDFCVSCLESAYRHTMFVNFSCVMIPKEVFSKVNFDQDIRYGEDLDFLLRSMKFFRYKCVPLALTKYRYHENMITQKKWNEIEDNNKKITANALRFWRET